MKIKNEHAVIVADCMVSYAGVVEDIVRQDAVQYLQLCPSSKSGIRVLVPLKRIRKLVLQDAVIPGGEIDFDSLN